MPSEDGVMPGDDLTVPQGGPALRKATRSERRTRANRERRGDEIARLVADRSRELNDRLKRNDHSQAGLPRA